MVNFCKSTKCLVGKTAIVTGANTGIGYTTALDFAKRGCRVILACRSQDKGTEACNNIVKETGNVNVIYKNLNLESMKSVRSFAADFINTESRLDLLINNAGAYLLPDKVTEDGLQVEMATNYFGHFLLTNLLLDLLKKSAPSRVVNVSSRMASLMSNLKLEKLNKFNGDYKLYGKTKLCNILFTQELAKRMEGSGVTTYSLHPGVVKTEFTRKNSAVFRGLSGLILITPEEGAQTTLYVALTDGIEDFNGQHFDNCKRVKPYSGAKDPRKAEQLWELSAELVGLKSS